MPEEKKQEYNITVLSRREVSTFPAIGKEVRQMLITYVGGNLPPNTVTIEKDKYSLEVEKKLIRADVEKRIKEKPEMYKV